jgi:hypothetical protein
MPFLLISVLGIFVVLTKNEELENSKKCAMIKFKRMIDVIRLINFLLKLNNSRKYVPIRAWCFWD